MVAGTDAFIIKLNDAGSMIYSTYLGGMGNDETTSIAVETNGNAYVTGTTMSDAFPTTANAIQPNFARPGGGAMSKGDAFVSKMSADGSTLLYSTYLGGSGDDGGNGITVDNHGSAYVTGYAGSTDFPTTSGVFQPSGHGSAFASKLSADGSALIYSTYLGGSQNDLGMSIAIDDLGASI